MVRQQTYMAPMVQFQVISHALQYSGSVHCRCQAAHVDRGYRSLEGSAGAGGHALSSTVDLSTLKIEWLKLESMHRRFIYILDIWLIEFIVAEHELPMTSTTFAMPPRLSRVVKVVHERAHGICGVIQDMLETQFQISIHC